MTIQRRFSKFKINSRKSKRFSKKKFKNKFSKKRCPKGEILNPRSGLCVSENGTIGRRLLKNKTQQMAKRKEKCEDGFIRNPTSGRCVSVEGPTGKKLLKEKEAKKDKKVSKSSSKSESSKTSKSSSKSESSKTSKSTSSKTSKSTSSKKDNPWPKSFGPKDLEYLDYNKFKPSRSEVQNTTKKYVKKYPEENNEYIFKKVTKKFNGDIKGWTDKSLKNYLLRLLWTRKVGSPKLVIKTPDIYDIQIAVLKRIFEKEPTDIQQTSEQIASEFPEKSVEGYPRHKNPLYNKKDPNSKKYYDGFVKQIKDQLQQEIFDLSSFNYKKNRKKLLEFLNEIK
jgi:hypothetical protein